MGRLLEADSLAVLEAFGVPTVPHGVAADPEAARRCFPGRVVLKAHVPLGGRGKAGFVRVTDDPAATAGELLGREFGGFAVTELLVSPAVEIRREWFAAVALESTPVALFSADGGVDVAAAHRRDVDIRRGLLPHEARELVVEAGLRGPAVNRAAAVLVGLYRAFRARDCLLVEVNPLVELADGRVAAASAVVHVDDRAEFRQPGLPVAGHDGARPWTEAERRMREVDAIDPEVGHIRFHHFPGGRVALMVTGGGGGAIAFDTLAAEGLEPATTFDISIGDIEEKVRRATRIILGLPGLAGLVAGSNFTNFAPVTARCAGLIRALREAPPPFPVVLRFCGPGQEEAAALAAGIPGVTWCDERVRLDEAVRLLAAQVRERESGAAGRALGPGACGGGAAPAAGPGACGSGAAPAAGGGGRGRTGGDAR
jgi:succinyl-CoA synthetase beta subunit